MGLSTFAGGVHPNDGKKLAMNAPVQKYLPQGDLVFLLSQHIGAPAKPIVARGDRVLRGQKIAEAVGKVSAPVHSSVSGTVKAIESRVSPNGMKCEAIIVTNDGLYEEVEYETRKPYQEMSADEILDIIGEAGIVGMGGAGFLTKLKLSADQTEKIDYVIANGAECEPYVTADYRRMLENPELVVDGMKIVLHLFPNARGVIAIENNKPECIAKLKELVKSEPRIHITVLHTKYPQGAARQLIYAVTKRAMNREMHSADIGCMVANVETLVSIRNAVIDGKPSVDRIITITGDGVATPANYLVPFGTNQRELFEAAGGDLSKTKKLVSGGPMMGFALYTLDTPVIKTSSCLLCLGKDEVVESRETACINCGQCVQVCPSRLLPSRLASAAKNHDDQGFLKLNGMECMDCGSCSYICPAKRQLTQAIGFMKKNVKAQQRK